MPRPSNTLSLPSLVLVSFGHPKAVVTCTNHAVGWKGYVGQYHTIPLYACAFVCILAFCFLSDRYQNKPLFISIAAGMGTVFFVSRRKPHCSRSLV